jgi:hypothetical protein
MNHEYDGGDKPLPTAAKSERDMQKDLPAALRYLKSKGAHDIVEMLGIQDA